MVLIAADGGNRLHGPANTLPSLLSAWVAGADALIVDVRQAHGGDLVTPHDRRLAALLDELPAEAAVIVRLQVDDGDDVAALAVRLEGVVARSGGARRCVVATASFDALTAITALRRVYIASPEDSALRCIHAGAQGVLVTASQVFDGAGATDFHATLAAEAADGEMPLGILVAVDGLGADAVRAVAALDGVECVVGGSALALAALRPRRALDGASFAGEADVVRHRTGRAGDGASVSVHPRDGVLVELAPDDGASVVAGGVGTAFPLDGDFSAEVDFEADPASPTVRLGVALVNVDPPDADDGPAGVDGYFLPRAFPPLVGVERDGDRGFRAHHNLGAQADADRFGRPVGDATSAGGSLRVERRGAWFASYYRDAAHPEWVCVGTSRNDSMNGRVYLRCVASRGPSESAADAGVKHRVSFRDLRVEVVVRA